MGCRQITQAIGQGVKPQRFSAQHPPDERIVDVGDAKDEDATADQMLAIIEHLAPHLAIETPLRAPGAEKPDQGVAQNAIGEIAPHQ